MIKRNIISTATIESTGYVSWLDFLLNVRGYRLSKGTCTYQYDDNKGVRKEIELGVGQSALDRLGWEEARQWLEMLEIPRFADYRRLMDNHRMLKDREEYRIETIVRRRDGQIELRYLTINERDWEKILEWEEKYADEFVFIERHLPERMADESKRQD